MCVVDFDLCFTYVYVGWEDSAHDSRVFIKCINDSNVCFPTLVGGTPFSLIVLMLYLVCLTKMCLVLQIIVIQWTLDTVASRDFYPHTGMNYTIKKPFVKRGSNRRMQCSCLTIGTLRFGQLLKEHSVYGMLDLIYSKICHRI